MTTNTANANIGTAVADPQFKIDVEAGFDVTVVNSDISVQLSRWTWTPGEASAPGSGAFSHSYVGADGIVYDADSLTPTTSGLKNTKLYTINVKVLGNDDLTPAQVAEALTASGKTVDCIITLKSGSRLVCWFYNDSTSLEDGTVPAKDADLNSSHLTKTLSLNPNNNMGSTAITFKLLVSVDGGAANGATGQAADDNTSLTDAMRQFSITVAQSE